MRNNIFIFFFIGLSMVSCSDKVKEIDLSDIPELTPKALTSFDQADSLYFSHLSYKSIGIASDRIIIADRQNKFVILVDDEGNIIKRIREGRGPGEILDVYEMTKSSGNIVYLNDSDNKKVLMYDEDLNLISEFKPKPYEGGAIENIYPGVNSSFIFELTTFDFLENKEKDREKIFVQYNLENKEYGNAIIIKDRPYARTYVDGRLVGASEVPYSDIALTAYNSENKSLFIYETSKSEIIEIDAYFDTLSTTSVNLPKQKLSDTEIDSLRDGERSEQWKTMSSYLPEFKSEAERFFYNKNRFWLQSNLRGDYQKWFVLNMDGQIIKIARFPKNVMVTHISDENIGVRLNDVEFSLFENIKLETED